MALVENKRKYVKSLAVVGATAVSVVTSAVIYLDQTKGGGFIAPEKWLVISPILTFVVAYAGRIIKQKNISN